MSQFTLSIHLYEHGTVQATVKVGEQTLTIFATYLDDALGGLAEAVLSLLWSPLADAASCSWHFEPGEHRWLFRRTLEGVQVEILRFDTEFSGLPNERGERVFGTECSLLRLATQVKGQLHRLLNELGEQGYAAWWHYPFPMAAFQQLEAQIHELKHASEVAGR